MRRPPYIGFRLQIVGLIALTSLTVTLSADLSQLRTPAESIAIPKDAIALEGIPSVRVDTTEEGGERRQLNPAEAIKDGLKINVIDGKYYWASRSNRPLTLISSGEFTYLSSTEPGKYIRLRRLNDRISYVEHLDMTRGSVTYWGEIRIILGK
jgi:hypothetical protein